MNRSKKLDKQTLYEIYRACRLCGAGAGYKMPIIQNLVQVDSEEVELKQKILECLQLEVNSNDKMPPLICELCVDKLDDFYEFLTTCRQTNANTRKLLGLPLQNTPAKVTPAPVKVTPTKVAPVPKKVISKDIGTETCMLGLIEASSVKQDIYIVSRRQADDIKKTKNSKVKKEETKLETPIKAENTIASKSPTLKQIKQNKDIQQKQGKEKDSKRKREPSPKRTTRQNNSLDEALLTKVQEAPKNLPITKPGPKSRKMETKEDPPPKPTRAKEKEDPPPKLTKKEDEPSKSKGKRDRDDECLSKLKRGRERDAKTELTPPPAKKTKSSDPPKQQPNKPQKSSKSSPKSVPSTTTASKPVQPGGVPCPACKAVLKSIVGFKNHMHYVHPVTWTPDNLACNACRTWFPTIEESVAHHKRHASYKCLRCRKKFKNGVLYHQHVENKRCLPEQEVPDVKCESCWQTFPTDLLLKEHRCVATDGRQGGKCSKCHKHYTHLKNLAKHESTCLIGKKVVVEPAGAVDPAMRKMLLPMEVRIAKCDDLLQYGPVVSACTVPHRFGLDRKMSYPYMPKLRVIKKPTYKPMVSIQDEVKKEFNTEDFDWADFEDIEIKTVKKLSSLCLKVIFSSKMLGELEIIDEIGLARRSALKKRIESIIYKFDDASSNNSDSILDKNAIAKTFEVVNDKFGSDDRNYHSDSTVFDEATLAEGEEKGSDMKIDNFDEDLVDNHDSTVNLGADNGRIDNHKLNSSILSNTDVDINEPCDTSVVTVKQSTNEHIERSITLRDDTTNDLSSSLNTVNEEQLESNKLEVDKLKLIRNPTDTVNVTDILLNENMRLDNIRSSNDSPSVINTENSTNDDDSAIVTEKNGILDENDDVLSKNDVISSEEPCDSVVKSNDSLTNHNKPSLNDNDLTGNASHTENMEIEAETNNLDNISVSNEDTTTKPQNGTSNDNDTKSHDDDKKTDVENNISVSNEGTTTNPQNGNSNDNDTKSHDDDKKTDVENMEIDETFSINSINYENTTKISDNSDTETIGKVSNTKISTDNDESVESYTKNPDININTNSSTEKNLQQDIVQNINETETKSPQKANKSLDFSVTGILNHVTSKNMDADLKNVIANIENHKTTITNLDSIENDTKEDTTAENDTKKETTSENDTKSDTINDDNQIPDYISFDTSLNKRNDDNPNASDDSVNKKEDTVSVNSISITFTEKSDDTISLNSQYVTEVNKSDKFNVNDLSEDERILMAELDEQIGETNDKIEKLSDGRDLNLENFNDGYNFD